jgi:hypothetical protein
VRDCLEEIRGSLSGKRPMSLGELSKATMSDERNEAVLRLHDAATRLFGYHIIEKAPIQQDKLSKIVDVAMDGLSNQSRHRLATTRPVQLIWNAIVEAHDRTKPNLVHLSWSPGCAFREIVCICYEAITGWIVDPERAIKGFVRSERRREDQQREDIGVKEELVSLGVSTSPRARGRPRKTISPPRKRI